MQLSSNEPSFGVTTERSAGTTKLYSDSFGWVEVIDHTRIGDFIMFTCRYPSSKRAWVGDQMMYISRHVGKLGDMLE